MPQLQLTSEESEDERIERTDRERRQQINSMLGKLPMSPIERQFVINTAEKMVDLACEDYVQAMKTVNLNPQCISAAATVAMMIVYDG